MNRYKELREWKRQIDLTNVDDDYIKNTLLYNIAESLAIITDSINSIRDTKGEKGGKDSD